jgi:hypothetical protein
MKKATSIILMVCLCLAGTAYISSGAAMPGTRVLDSLKDAYAPVKFDHGKHTMIAGSCSACHHEHAMGEGLPCKQCHALTPETFKRSAVHSFMPCKNCHGAFDRDNASMPGLKTAYHRTCFTCHRGMGGIGMDPKGCTGICHAKRAEQANSKLRKER